MKTRRQFLRTAAAVTVGFSGLQRLSGSAVENQVQSDAIYGPLIPDPDGILDLPHGFSYQVLSRTGDLMDDGWKVSGKPDGMAAFDAPTGQTVIIRNHELALSMTKEGGLFDDLTRLPEGFDPDLCYDVGAEGESPYFGGTSTLVYDCHRQRLDGQFQSLFGTDRNCAGGPTPWGTWISCEEPDPKEMVTSRGQNHGYCFEVWPTLTPQLQKPVLRSALGRFRHEAIAVDPETQIVYLTEDLPDGLIYRFVPDLPGNLEQGKFETLMINDFAGQDTTMGVPVGRRFKAQWKEMEEIDSPKNDLRVQGQGKGGSIFARGEGMWYGHDAIYWVCTTGGENQGGQIWRYFPKTSEVELYLEPNDHALLQNGDNMTIARWGDLIVCEDAKKESNMLRGVTPEGRFYTLAANSISNSEFAGACFSPNHDTLFVNIQSPGMTLAITGDWARNRSW